MDEISATIIRLLQRELGRPLTDIRLDSLLVADLSLDGDDYGMSFVPALQKEFRIKVPRSEWEKVYTVKDVVDVVRRHRNASE